jgi:hypothetical protein
MTMRARLDRLAAARGGVQDTPCAVCGGRRTARGVLEVPRETLQRHDGHCPTCGRIVFLLPGNCRDRRTP